MANTSLRVELNREGVRAMLRSSEMQETCRHYADLARAKLGEGYEVTTYQGKNRCNASIAADSYKARKENLEENKILKAVGSL